MLILECSKSDYWGTAFVVPLLSVAFIFLLGLISLQKLFRSYQDAKSLRKPILCTISCLITVIYLFVVHFPTFRYGVFLPTVSEEDVQYKEGCVTSITNVPFSPRYSIEGDEKTYRASFVQIDDVVFYFLNAEGLKIGDKIAISYLPRCNMVLTCQVAEN